MKKKILLLLLSLALLGGCAAAESAPEPTAEPTPVPTLSPTPAPTLSPAEREALAAAEAAQQESVEAAETLAAQGFYDEALDLLSSAAVQGELTERCVDEIRAARDALVNYTGDIPHIFFHSLILYPEMIYTDMETPRIENNQEFCLLSEIEAVLPQLYERGYVLYDLDQCFEKVDGVMTRREILLPPGKRPLILSVDDVAYAYGPGYASRLFVRDGQLLYEVTRPDGSVEERLDGDVMGVVDLFVAEHPDFAWRGHKGTLALTGYQGAFGYPDYEAPENREAIAAVAQALKDDGWNFASHSYTHNGGQYGYWGEGWQVEKISYDVNKWVDRVASCLGPTRLFIAPFGYRAVDEGLQAVLDAGFDVYCTVADDVINAVYPDYALMSRVEICGYSFTYFTDTLNEWFCNVDEVFDASRRPPVPR